MAPVHGAGMEAIADVSQRLSGAESLVSEVFVSAAVKSVGTGARREVDESAGDAPELRGEIAGG